MQNVITRQKLVMKKLNKESATYGTSRIDPKAFIILDDCLYDSSWSKDKNIRAMFMNGRHLKLFFIITTQYPLEYHLTYVQILILFLFFVKIL